MVNPWSIAAWMLALLGWPTAGAVVAAGSGAALIPRLEGLEHPVSETIRIAGLGQLHAGRLIVDALRRVWWPPLLAAALVSRRVRRAAFVAAVAPPAIEWVQHRPPIGPVRYMVLRLLDDAAYGAGVWLGAIRHRSTAALRPDLTSWPGRGAAVANAPTPER